MLDRYPSLKKHPHAQAYLRLANYILFIGDRDPDTKEILLPYQHVHALVEDWRHEKGHAAIDWIENFSRDVFPLNITEYSYSEGLVRTVKPELHPELFQMMRQGLMQGTDGDRVNFVTGNPVSSRAQRKIEKEYESFLRVRSLSHAADKSQPAHELLEYLSEQPQNYLKRVLDENWPLVRQAVDALPESTERERARKNSCSLIMGRLNEFRQCHYISVQKTPRIFTTGATIHQLPSEIRKIALKGATELDLKACQLAIVAKLWDIGELQTFLASGRSIWTELLEHLDLPASNKPIIKTTIYSILFGMGQRSLRRQLAHGDKRNSGIGVKKSRLFFRHPLVMALLEARGRQLRSVQASRGGWDAFGHWRSTSDGQQEVKLKWNQRDPRARSVLAAIVQSYEVKLMLAMLPVLKANRQIYLLSWLHDGVTLKFGNHTKKERQIKKLKAVIAATAQSMGFITTLESTEL